MVCDAEGKWAMARFGTTLSAAARLYRTMLARPHVTLLACAAVILAFGAGLVGVRKDPSVDAFVPDGHAAAVAREEARRIFGLEDPIIIGLTAREGESAFTPEILAALRAIAEAVEDVDGVESDGLISLASENAITGRDGDLFVDPVLEDGPVTEQTAALAWERFNAMPIYAGLLGSETGDTVTLIVPVDDPNHAEATYMAILAIAERLAPEGAEAHVAGVAAMNARLAQKVDRDTRILVPLTALIVLGVVWIALRNPMGLIGPTLVILGSTVIAVGMMGWVGARYYLISTALPVVVMSIAVADSLHVTTLYLRARVTDPRRTARQAVDIALRHAWLPVTITSLSTIAGFVGLSFGAAMQPISEFGQFAAVGVGAAWALSLIGLPALLILIDLAPSDAGAGDRRTRLKIDAAMHAVASLPSVRPRAVAGGLVLGVAIFFAFASRAEFDYQRSSYFTADDAVSIADSTLNDRLAGLNFLDVVVVAPEPGGLMEVEALQAIDQLSAQIAALPLVGKVSAITDYVALMHRALTDAAPGALPTVASAPAQYMFLYEASAPPEDFAEEIDYDQQRALIRAQLSTDQFTATLPVVERLYDITARWSRETGLTASVSGRVAVNDGWMSTLANNHFRGLALAGGLVFLTTIAAFRAVRPAVLAMAPVLTGVVFVYAMMGVTGVDIAPATSMTAAIATGLGVDFGIHLIAHVRRRLSAGASIESAIDEHYAVVARACFYSAAALGVGLSALAFSSAAPLRWFGLLVGSGVLGSLVGAFLLVPLLLSSIAPQRRAQHA